MEQLAGHTDKLHILVNNAGTTWGEPLEKYQDKGECGLRLAWWARRALPWPDLTRVPGLGRCVCSVGPGHGP